MPSVAIATAVGTNCFFFPFSGHWPLAARALAASFQCLSFRTSTQLAVQQLQQQNVSVDSLVIVFSLSGKSWVPLEI